MISGDLDYVDKKCLQELKEEIGDVERMLKAMIKSLKNSSNTAYRGLREFVLKSGNCLRSLGAVRPAA